jgi:DNA-binding response OmpR family regulator
MLHNLVRRVRRKLEVQGLPAEELIVSVPGSGYRVG